ncbi:MAG TPA: DNA methyltransferase [Massilibacterium sp.]|nr:DNA methyltransferase [Massilibacterium sp.]
MNPTKEYKGRSHIRMFNMDCMYFMKYCDKYDLAIVDPPYGINASKGTGGYSRDWLDNVDKKWDDHIPDKYYFKALYDTSENQIIWGGNYFHLPHSRGWICWYKSDEVKGRDFSEFELAFTSFDKPARHYEEKPFIRNGRRIHPTQKPIQLYKWLLTNYAKEDDKILDTHGGSMSIAIACWDLGFDLDIIELDEDYFNDAVKRFEQHISQTQLDI